MAQSKPINMGTSGSALPQAITSSGSIRFGCLPVNFPSHLHTTRAPGRVGLLPHCAFLISNMLENLTLRLPARLRERTIPVQVLAADGKPVQDANIWLSPVTDPYSVVGTSVSHTNVDGIFDLVGVEGTDYLVNANKYAGFGDVACAKTVILPANGGASERIRMSLTIDDYDICTRPNTEVAKPE
jgi:hypothetical protein